MLEVIAGILLAVGVLFVLGGGPLALFGAGPLLFSSQLGGAERAVATLMLSAPLILGITLVATSFTIWRQRRRKPRG